MATAVRIAARPTLADFGAAAIDRPAPRPCHRQRRARHRSGRRSASRPRTRQQRGLGQRLGLQCGRRERGRRDQPGPGGGSCGGVDQVVGEDRRRRRSHSRASMPDVATPPAADPERVGDGAGQRMAHAHLPGALRVRPRTRRSPPQSTAQRPWRSRRAARKSAAHPLTDPPRSSSRPAGRRITPARSSTSTARHLAAGSGRAGRRGGAESSPPQR